MLRFVQALPVLSTALVAMTPWSAVAQQISCGERDLVIEQLDQKFAERRIGMGVVNPTTIFEIYASKVTGTWTILQSDVNGKSCIMVTGGFWENFDPEFASNISVAPTP